MASFMKSFVDGTTEIFYSGDPIIREFFLLKTNVWPFVLCGIYLLAVKLGPVYMKNRQPYDLRSVMFSYNIILVTTYTYMAVMTIFYISQIGHNTLCYADRVNPDDYTYNLARLAWLNYLLKYVEFLDTIFFILRKRNKLISKLHVTHHSIMAMFGWILLRTDNSGFQAYPALLNGIIHIVMYSYYCMAAMGLHKYLWWKKYLTMAQMAQFIAIFLFTSLAPVIGCRYVKTTLYINYAATVFFFGMFFNFYLKTFQSSKSKRDDSTRNNDEGKLRNGILDCSNGYDKVQNGKKEE